MAGPGNVRSGKCLSGEMPSRGSFRRGSVSRELSLGECQSGKCSVGELSACRFNCFVFCIDVSNLKIYWNFKKHCHVKCYEQVTRDKSNYSPVFEVNIE